MAYKYYNHKSFDVELSKDAYIVLQCSTQNTRYGFRHVCDFIAPGDRFFTRAKCCYYNRTWERFKYESVLSKAACKLPPEWSAAVRAMCDKIAADEKAAAERMYSDFKSAYDAAPEGVKNALKNITITSEDEARAVTGILKAAALLQAVSEN